MASSQALMLDTTGYSADFTTVSYGPECPSERSLLSNCTERVWCVVGHGESGACSGNDSSTTSHCTWNYYEIVDVVDFPFDCETVYDEIVQGIFRFVFKSREKLKSFFLFPCGGHE